MAAADWLERAMFDGLSRLLLATLEYAPSIDTLPGVAKVWATAVSDDRVYQEDLDLWRIQKAFRKLAATSSRWPNPAALLAAMPQRKTLAQLRPPKPDPEVARSAFAEISEMLHADPDPDDRTNIKRNLDDATRELMHQLDQRQGAT